MAWDYFSYYPNITKENLVGRGLVLSIWPHPFVAQFFPCYLLKLCLNYDDVLLMGCYKSPMRLNMWWICIVNTLMTKSVNISKKG